MLFLYVCVHIKLCDTSTILTNRHVDHQSCPEVLARVYLDLNKMVEAACFQGCKQKKCIFSSIFDFNIHHAYVILKLVLVHARWLKNESR